MKSTVCTGGHLYQLLTLTWYTSSILFLEHCPENSTFGHVSSINVRVGLSSALVSSFDVAIVQATRNILPGLCSGIPLNFSH